MVANGSICPLAKFVLKSERSYSLGVAMDWIKDKTLGRSKKRASQKLNQLSRAQGRLRSSTCTRVVLDRVKGAFFASTVSRFMPS